MTEYSERIIIGLEKMKPVEIHVESSKNRFFVKYYKNLKMRD